MWCSNDYLRCRGIKGYRCDDGTAARMGWVRAAPVTLQALIIPLVELEASWLICTIKKSATTT
jgi:hypothetical protein